MLSRSHRLATSTRAGLRAYNSAATGSAGFTPNASGTTGPRSPRPQSGYASQGQGQWPKRLSGFRPSTFVVDHIKELKAQGKVPHLKTLADLSPEQIAELLRSAAVHKFLSKNISNSTIKPTLAGKTVALIFNKRSTRTRVASETAATLLKGSAMFLGSQDIQLGVNETLQDSALVIGSMADGFMARVGPHSDIEELCKYSPVPVINALSDLYHPTQILADLLTLHEHYHPDSIPHDILDSPDIRNHKSYLHGWARKNLDPFASLQGKKVAWVGDTNNISNELLVTLPRLGMHFAIASPKGYDKVDPRVWAEVENAGTQNLVTLTNSPAEALKDADVVVTDTWISMGQEEEKKTRLEAFAGYQITNKLVEDAGANPDWIFMHCLPRKQEEVDDEVFYGPRSIVFPEAENRKWTILAVFDAFIGKWQI